MESTAFNEHSSQSDSDIECADQDGLASSEYPHVADHRVIDAVESNTACDGTWWKAYQCIGLVKSRMFAIEEATRAFETAIELVEKMDDSKKTQQYVKLLNKNMADMKSKKEVIVRYVYLNWKNQY